METKVAIIGIILEDRENVTHLNKILTDYGDLIIGRMGLPYKEKSLNIISIVIDAKEETIIELTEKIRKINKISVEYVCSN